MKAKMKSDCARQYCAFGGERGVGTVERCWKRTGEIKYCLYEVN